jgi:reactive intermediate/imine deaminase
MSSTQQPEENKRSLPFSDAVYSGDILYISGQVGIDQTSGQLVISSFEAEARQVMENLGAVLKKYKLFYHNLKNVTIYLTSMDNYAATNTVYEKYFDQSFPARVCIAVKELPLQAHIEIAAIASTRD